MRYSGVTHVSVEGLTCDVVIELSDGNAVTVGYAADVETKLSFSRHCGRRSRRSRARSLRLTVQPRRFDSLTSGAILLVVPLGIQLILRDCKQGNCLLPNGQAQTLDGGTLVWNVA
jgi:hypothetical protein